MSDPVPPRGADRRARRSWNRRGSGIAPRLAVVLGIVIAVAMVGLMVFLHVTDALGPGVH